MVVANSVIVRACSDLYTCIQLYTFAYAIVLHALILYLAVECHHFVSRQVCFRLNTISVSLCNACSIRILRGGERLKHTFPQRVVAQSHGASTLQRPPVKRTAATTIANGSTRSGHSAAREWMEGSRMPPQGSEREVKPPSDVSSPLASGPSAQPCGARVEP